MSLGFRVLGFFLGLRLRVEGSLRGYGPRVFIWGCWVSTGLTNAKIVCGFIDGPGFRVTRRPTRPPATPSTVLIQSPQTLQANL